MEMHLIHMPEFGIQAKFTDDFSWIWLQADADVDTSVNTAESRPAFDVRLQQKDLLTDHRVELPDGRMLSIREDKYGHKKGLEYGRRWVFQTVEGARDGYRPKVVLIQTRNPIQHPNVWYTTVWPILVLGLGALILTPITTNDKLTLAFLTGFSVSLGLTAVAMVSRVFRWWWLGLWQIVLPPTLAAMLGCFSAFIFSRPWTLDAISSYLSILVIFFLVLTGAGPHLGRKLFELDRTWARCREEAPPSTLAGWLWPKIFGKRFDVRISKSMEDCLSMNDKLPVDHRLSPEDRASLMGQAENVGFRLHFDPGFRRVGVEARKKLHSVYGLEEGVGQTVDLGDDLVLRVGPVRGWPMGDRLDVRVGQKSLTVDDPVGMGLNGVLILALFMCFLAGFAAAWVFLI